MDESRIVTVLFLEKPNFEEMTKAARSLEAAGIKPMLLPPEKRGLPTHLVVEKEDATKAVDVLSRLGMPLKPKELILIPLQNAPGTMAEATKKISDTGINLTYAFCVAVSDKRSYMLLDTADNRNAVELLNAD